MSCFANIGRRMENQFWNVPFTINAPAQADGSICTITPCNPPLYRENTLETIGRRLQTPFYNLIQKRYRCSRVCFTICSIIPATLAAIGYLISRIGQRWNPKYAFKTQALDKIEEIYKIYREHFSLLKDSKDVFSDFNYGEMCKSGDRFDSLKKYLASIDHRDGAAFVGYPPMLATIPPIPTTPAEQALYNRLQILYGEYNSLAERIRN